MATTPERQISGFSKLNKLGKIKWLAKHFFTDPEAVIHELKSYWHADASQQEVFDGFSENTVSNFYMPYGVAPNFVINGTTYAVPMVIEESSVVAAASAAAKFWLSRGGFKATILGTTKLGQLHFHWSGPRAALEERFADLEKTLRQSTADITANMEARGGGIRQIELIDFTDQEPNYYQLRVSFETCDSMGANFINSVLERFGESLTSFVQQQSDWPTEWRELTVIMAILSNYTPDCLVRAEVSCPVEELAGACADLDGPGFAEKFALAVRIAELDPYRATTHNKGIFNGIDAVVLATGNDFRAIEACGHTYASRDGQYRSLSHCTVEDGIFRFWLDLPLAVGTVGGLTKAHPMARTSLELLGQPSAETLMQIIATVGLAQNFAAVRSLVTTGIQRGHMKMHLSNILTQLEAAPQQKEAALAYFADKVVSFQAVRSFLRGELAKG